MQGIAMQRQYLTVQLWEEKRDLCGAMYNAIILLHND